MASEHPERSQATGATSTTASALRDPVVPGTTMHSDPVEQQVLFAAKFLQHHSGPLPAPETLAEYEQLLPGTANRIITAFEGQLAHRMAMESRVVRFNTLSQLWSTISGSILALFATASALALAWSGHYATGLTIFFTTLFTFLGTFVAGRRLQATERQEKLQANATGRSRRIEDPKTKTGTK